MAIRLMLMVVQKYGKYGTPEQPEQTENKTGINCKTGNKSRLERSLVAG